MANQTWLDTLNVTAVHDGTTETRLDTLSVLAVHDGTTETRLDTFNVFVVWSEASEGHGPGFQSLCLRISDSAEQKSGLVMQRGFWRYGEG